MHFFIVSGNIGQELSFCEIFRVSLSQPHMLLFPLLPVYWWKVASRTGELSARETQRQVNSHCVLLGMGRRQWGCYGPSFPPHPSIFSMLSQSLTEYCQTLDYLFKLMTLNKNFPPIFAFPHLHQHLVLLFFLNVTILVGG